MSEQIVVPARFNGPRESGNGGYSGGLLASRLRGAPASAEVSLRRPVPLDQPLEVREDEEGVLRATLDESTVAEARPLRALDLSLPAPVGVEEARVASAGYGAPREGLFAECFVCGPAREDSLGVFAGRVAGRDLVATPWAPPAWSAGADGAVRPEIVWAVLDCPTYFAAHLEGELTLSMLARQRVQLRSPLQPGAEHVVLAWPISQEGRKRLAGAAVLSAAGEALAVGEALLVEARQQPPA